MHYHLMLGISVEQVRAVKRVIDYIRANQARLTVTLDPPSDELNYDTDVVKQYLLDCLMAIDKTKEIV